MPRTKPRVGSRSKSRAGPRMEMKGPGKVQGGEKGFSC